MTDTPQNPPSPTLTAAQQAINFGRFSLLAANILAIALLGITIAGWCGWDIPGTRPIIILGLLFWGIGTAFAFCRHLLALHAYHTFVIWLEQQSTIMAMINAQDATQNATEAAPAKRPTAPQSSQVIDLMSRLRGDDDQKL